LAAIIIPAQSGTYRHLQGRVTALIAESGLTAEISGSAGALVRVGAS
jgi:hypothetical protein